MAASRLLILTPDYPPDTGGIQLLGHRLAQGIRRLDALVVAPSHPGADTFDRSSTVAVQRVHPPVGGSRARVAGLNAAALAIAERFRPDVVLSMHIVLSPTAAAIRRRWNAPVAQYLHSAEVGHRPRLAAFAVAHADATIANSRHTRELARRVRADEARLHVITPGVDLPERRPHPRSAQPTIVTVARIAERYKGHDTVIHALPLVRAHVPDVRWMVIGDGPLRPALEELCAVYGVRESVHFLGAAEDATRDAWLEQAQVFTMPSRLPGNGLGGEGFGIAYLEAGWHELPVVAGNAGGAVDAVLHGETGVLVDPDDAVAVADALTRLLLDRDLAARMGAHGAARAPEFAWPIITGRLEDLLLSLLAARR